MSNYIVQPFTFFAPTESVGYLYNSHVSVAIDNPEMYDLISFLSQNSFQLFSEEEVSQLIVSRNLPLKEAFQYLTNFIKVCKKVDFLTSPFRSIVVVSDIPSDLSELADDIGRTTGIKVGVASVEEFENLIDANTLCVAYIENYREQEGRMLVSEAKKANSYLKLAYVLGDDLLIDPIYQNALGTPCHVCNMYTLKQAEAKRVTLQRTSWFFTYKVLMDNGGTTFPRIPLSSTQRGLIFFHILGEVTSIIDDTHKGANSSNYLLGKKVNLVDGQVSKDILLHSEHCELCQS